ncbi:MAG: aldo/keto reductase, partial [Pseudomonadota bacterium]
MDYRFLGRTGIRVSNLCFGTMSFGGDADADTSGALYAACRDAGINFFDCANIYNGGQAEEILGGLIGSERDDLVITSKCYFPTGTDVNARGASRRHIPLAVEDSLRRLGTDRLDVLFVHHWDDFTPLEETLGALDYIVRSGRALYAGISSYNAEHTRQAVAILNDLGTPCLIHQPS